jgi:hypothetical protein
MSALVRLLYPSPPASRNVAAIVGWWERRRFSYNLVVGTAGVVTILGVNLGVLLPPDGRWLGFPPLLAVGAYAVLVNLCYSAGWLAELVFNRWWGNDPPRVGPILFRQGLIFSVGVTLLPLLLAGLQWGARVLRGIF